MKSRKSINAQMAVGLVRVFLAGLFVALALSAYWFPYFGWELQISRYVQGFKSSPFGWSMNFISELGNGFNLVFLVGGSGFLLFLSGYRREALEVGLYTFGTYLLGSLVKLVISRPRPEPWLIEIPKIVPDKSFPSLHVLLYTVFFGYLIHFAFSKIKNQALKYFLIVISSFLILTIGLSRIYLGAHWAGDTLGGYLAGALIISFYASHAKR